MKRFKTVKEGIEFFNDFTLFGKASQMWNYYYNLLDKKGELEGNYKKGNNIVWDIFSDWEAVIGEIESDLHRLSYLYGLGEGEKLEYLNCMAEWYKWYIEF